MTEHQAVVLLLDLGLIILLARALAALARKLDQPAVLGEILAGILVGPTLFHGAIANALFPADVRPLLSAIANVGIAVFMFLMGLDLDRDLLRGRNGTIVTVSLGAMLLSLATGVALGFFLHRDHPSVPALGFALFVGAAVAVTAFPVLARILTDRDLHRTPLGGLALACAAIDDVLAWLVLAAVLTIVGGHASPLRTLLLVPYLALCVFAVRPLLSRLLRVGGADRLTVNKLAVLIAGLLLSGGLTEWLGLHFIFGAFLFGLLVPRADFAALRRRVVGRVEQVNGVFFVPVYFIVAGLNVNLSHLDADGLLELGLILLVAIGSKFGGAYLTARARNLPRREAAALATLMNTRGLTELIILSTGLQLGVLDTKLYSLMVVMAVLTTAMAGPLLRVIRPPRFVPAPETEALARKPA